MNKKISIIVLIVLIAGAGLAYAGFQYTKKQGAANFAASGNGTTTNGNNAAGRQNGTARSGARNANFNGASGQIAAKDDTSITIKLSAGGSVIAFYSASTQVSKSEVATISDLIVGANIMASGTKADVGSVNATSIQIRPAGFVDANNSGRMNPLAGQRQQPSGVGNPGGNNNPGGSVSSDPNRANRDFAAGEITVVNGNTITVKMSDGTTKNVTVSDTTKISKTSAAQAGDLTVGQNVIVMGSKNSDGSISSRSIQLVPEGQTPGVGYGMPRQGVNNAPVTAPAQ